MVNLDDVLHQVPKYFDSMVFQYKHLLDDVVVVAVVAIVSFQCVHVLVPVEAMDSVYVNEMMHCVRQSHDLQSRKSLFRLKMGFHMKI